MQISREYDDSSYYLSNNRRSYVKNLEDITWYYQLWSLDFHGKKYVCVFLCLKSSHLGITDCLTQLTRLTPTDEDLTIWLTKQTGEAPFKFKSTYSPPVRWGLLDFMSAGPPSSSSAGPSPQAPDQSVPRRTSTTKNLWRYIYQIECQKECQNIWQKVCQNRCRIECQKRCENKC